jgi:hypothetical protein
MTLLDLMKSNLRAHLFRSSANFWQANLQTPQSAENIVGFINPGTTECRIYNWQIVLGHPSGTS